VLLARDLWVSPPGEGVEPVVRGASLTVAAGEWLAVTGPNGGGKSTLLLALAGLWPLRRGTVEIDGRPLTPETADEVGRPGVVLQDLPSQLLQPSVSEEIGFGPRNLGWSGERTAAAVGRWLGRFGLGAVHDRDPRSLAAGFQQVTLIAAALAADPRLLLVDEGGAHLDPETRRRVIGVLREEVGRGLALVWVTQEPDEIAAADRVLTVGEGTVSPAPGEAARPPVPGPPPAAGAPSIGRLSLRPPDGQAPRGARIAVVEERVVELPGRGIVAVHGRNGSGKSTLLGALAGVLDSPQVSVDWRGAGDAPILAAQHPDEQIFAERVEEEVLFAAIQRGRPEAEARRMAVSHFESLGLGSRFLERRTWGISLGEKRIVQAVAAIIAPARVVLLDEPTSGLDRDRRDALGAVVRGRSGEGPVVVAGHDSGWLETPPESRIKLG